MHHDRVGSAVTRLVGIELGGSLEPWQAVGLSFDATATALVGTVGVTVRIDEPPGIRRLVVAGSPDPGVLDVDGVAVAHDDAREPHGSTGHALQPTVIDHVVMMTSSLDRSIDEVTSKLGVDLRRVREAGPVRQAFFRLGEVILEVVQSPQMVGDVAALWGLVFTVADLDAEVERLGPAAVSIPKDAVQPGRRIATIRAELGCGPAVALMSP
jgi:hypothetical protein